MIGKIYKADILITQDIDAYLQMHQNKSLLRFISCGSVDDGKSTLIGRLLYDSKSIFEDQLFDIALVDINLPDCDGTQLIKKLKAIQGRLLAGEKKTPSSELRSDRTKSSPLEPELTSIETMTTPMIAVSAHVFNEEVEEYLASGFDGFLPKPLEKEALENLIIAQLGGKALLLP